MIFITSSNYPQIVSKVSRSVYQASGTCFEPVNNIFGLCGVRSTRTTSRSKIEYYSILAIIHGSVTDKQKVLGWGKHSQTLENAFRDSKSVHESQKRLQIL